MTNTTAPADAIRARLAEVRARVANATRGPWKVEVETYQLNERGNELREGKEDEWTYTEHHVYEIITGWRHPQAGGEIRVVAVSFSPYFEGPQHQIHWHAGQADAEFVAAARTDVPDLCDLASGMVDTLAEARRHFETCYEESKRIGSVSDVGINAAYGIDEIDAAFERLAAHLSDGRGDD